MIYHLTLAIDNISAEMDTLCEEACRHRQIASTIAKLCPGFSARHISRTALLIAQRQALLRTKIQLIALRSSIELSPTPPRITIS